MSKPGCMNPHCDGWSICKNCLAPESSGKFSKSSGEGVILNNPSPVIVSKQSPSRLNHFFTYFYKNVNEIGPIVTELKYKAIKGKLQTELTKDGKPHLQGMVWCKTKCRDSCFKLLKGAHFERLKDIDDTANYCNKEESHDGVYRISWGFPEPKYVEEIDELYEWEIEIETLLKSKPDKRTVHWFWEPEGCAGKTTYQKYVFTHHDRVIALSGKGSDMKNGVIAYEATNKCLPRIVLINVPRSSTGFVSYCGMEEIKDMFFYSGKYEGGMVCGACPHLIVFANEEPSMEMLSRDRYKIKNIAQD